MSKWKTHIVLDVESDGPCPGLYNMISFGLVCVGDPAQSFLGEVAPIIDNPGIAAAREVSGVSFETQKSYRAAELVMADAKAWLDEIAGAMGDKVKIVKLNVDESPKTASKYGVMSIPTLMIFKGGEMASRQVGAAPKAKLQQWISAAV